MMADPQPALELTEVVPGRCLYIRLSFLISERRESPPPLPLSLPLPFTPHCRDLMHYLVTTLTSLSVIYYKVQCLSSRDPTGENPAFSLPISTAQV